MTFLRRSGKRFKIRFPNAQVCALKMSRRAWPKEKSHRLTALATLLDLPQDGTHRALGDCRRTLSVYQLAAARLGRSGLRLG